MAHRVLHRQAPKNLAGPLFAALTPATLAAGQTHCCLQDTELPGSSAWKSPSHISKAPSLTSAGLDSGMPAYTQPVAEGKAVLRA